MTEMNSDNSFWLHSCSCCGGEIDKHDHSTYEEGDMCSKCFEQSENKALQIITDGFSKIRAALKPENQAKWDNLDFESKLYFFDKAMQDGILTWQIKSR